MLTLPSHHGEGHRLPASIIHCDDPANPSHATVWYVTSHLILGSDIHFRNDANGRISRNLKMPIHDKLKKCGQASNNQQFTSGMMQKDRNYARIHLASVLHLADYVSVLQNLRGQNLACVTQKIVIILCQELQKLVCDLSQVGHPFIGRLQTIYETARAPHEARYPHEQGPAADFG